MKLIAFYILGLVILCFLSCGNQLNDTSKLKSTNQDSTESYRPQFHFAPQKNWVNDPNGLVFNNGVYHLFFQYNPFGSKWGHMSWGHAISKDLMHWKEQPVAIPEFTNADSITTMIFSGSAVVDSFNSSDFAEQKGQVPLVAIYTSNVVKKENQLAQNQSIAYSLDEGVIWKQYSGNPVLDIGSKEFRDPKVFWYAPDKKWIMVVSKATIHKVQFYESANLKKWKLLSEFGNIGNTDKVWECPDIYQLSVEGTNEKKWVLSLSAGGQKKDELAMQYFVGDFDGKKFSADPLSYPLYLDHGQDFYAGITYNNIPAADGRRIMIGWASSWNYARDIPTGNVWRGIYAIPRELHLRKETNQYFLIQQPVREYDSLRKETFSINNQEADSTFDIPFKGTSYEIEAVIEPRKAKIAGLKILKTGNEETSIYYDSESRQLLLDRTKSGDTSFSKKFSSIEKASVAMDGGLIKLRIVVDKCIVEVFANDGQTTITDLVFPLEKGGGIQLFTKGGKAVFRSVKVYNIKSLK